MAKKKGKRRATKAGLLGLAKAHRKAGRSAVADKLEARAAKMSGGGGGKRRGGKGRKRTSNPAKTAAAKKPAAKRKAKRKPKKTTETKTTTTTTERTSNPRRTKRKGGYKAKGGGKRKGGKRKGSGRTVSLTIRSSGKGRNKRLKANVGALKAATKGSGARYLDMRTGRLVKQSQIGRSSNPSIGSSGIAAIAGGVVLGAGIGEGMFRWFSTRQGLFGDTDNQGAWYGRSAITRIEANSGKCAAAVGVAGLVVSGVGWMLMGGSPVAGGFVFGLGVGHVAVAAKRGFLMLIAQFSKVEKGNERNLGNRLAPEFAKPVRDSLIAQAEYENRNYPQIGDNTKEGEIDLSPVDSLYGERARLNLTPNEIEQPTTNGGEAGPVAGLGDLRRRMQDARRKAQQKASGGGGVVVSDELRAMRQGLAGPAANYVEQFAQPAVNGCGGNCPPDHDCGPDCANKKHQNAASPDGTPLAGLPQPKAAPALPPVMHRWPAPRQRSTAPAAFGW